MWKTYGTAGETIDDNIIRRMRIACWVSKATDIQSEYLILIAIPRQWCVRERASMLRYTYVVSLVELSCIQREGRNGFEFTIASR